MRRLALTVLAGLLVTACSGSTPAGPASAMAGGSGSTADKPSTDVPRNWVTHLVGDNEVPARDTPAQGQVKYQLSADGTELSWQLISSNINNVFMAHIHYVPPPADPLTTNGGIVLWLYGTPPSGNPPGPGTGPQDGVLSEGVAHASDLTGALAGHPLSDLIAAMDAGRTYTNVHTNDGVDGTNTGPGDFPGGEIRGQIKSAGN
jgi:CHRD domain